MNKIPFKFKFWFWRKRILNLNFSELVTVFIAIIVAVSIAYPQIKELNTKEKVTEFVLTSNDGSVKTGKFLVKQESNITLSILSIIGIILGPVALIWKFTVDSKDIDKFYNTIFEKLKTEFNELSERNNFKVASDKDEIIKLFTKINDRGRVDKNDLLNLKIRIYATQHMI